MKYTLTERDGRWILSDGTHETAYDSHDAALAALAAAVQGNLEQVRLALPDADAEAGLLPEWWTSDQGIAFSRATAGGRDFSQCAWTWRDPGSALLPVMFQTQNLPAHMEADLAGYIVELSGGGVGAVSARGRFYDNDAGRALRDVMAGGRRFGVSVDPTEKVDYEESFSCTAYDDGGECVDGEFSVKFSAYEIGGFTAEPHPCFEEASIVLEGQPMVVAANTSQTYTYASGANVTITKLVAAQAPIAPPAEWFATPEPEPGVPFLGGELGDEFLVDQGDGCQACPLTILDDGRVYGHLTYWGQCHVGEPWGRGVCASAQPSASGYAEFHTGHVICADGTDVPTGVLTVGCEHSSAFDCAGVRDHAAHAGLGWADVHITDGAYGPWLAGALRPNVTDDQVRLLRALSLSGEWVGELAAVIAVNHPGLPVRRVLPMAASRETQPIPQPVMRASYRVKDIVKLVGGNIVRRCPECEQRKLVARANGNGHADETLALLRVVERRTRHLVRAEAEAIRASLGD